MANLGSDKCTRIGLVVVHGIGPQDHGDTARQVLDGLDMVTARTDDCDPPWSDEDPTREHVVVCRKLVPDGPVVELLVVDAWWDDVVELDIGLRRRMRTWLWGLRIVPLMLQLSAAAAMVAAMERSDRRVAVTPPTRFSVYLDRMSGMPRGGWGWVLRGLHSALLRFLVFPPIALAALLIGFPLLQLADVVWRMVRGSATSPPGRVLDQVLRLTCGDAWAFVSDPERRDRIQRRVQDTLEWTQARCDSVVLLGHSQGGAISRAAISAGARADQLVTVGSGANLLGVLYNTVRKPQVSIVAWVILLGYPAFIVTIFTLFLRDVTTITTGFLGAVRDALEGRDSSSRVVTDVLQTTVKHDLPLMIGILLALGVVRLIIGRMRFDPSTLRPPIASWWDVSSLYDPVCVGGHVLEGGVHGVDVVNSTRLRHLLGEHVSYFTNPDVAGVVAAALASAQSGCHVEPTIRTTEDPRWHHMLAGYWWWGMPVTLGLTFLVLSLYQWLVNLVV